MSIQPTTTGLSTDRVPQDTNPKIPRVVRRGGFDISLSAVASGYLGYVTISDTISYSSAGYINAYPVIDVMIKTSSGGTDSIIKAPFTYMDTSTGTVRVTCYYSIDYTGAPGGGSADLNIYIWRNDSNVSGYSGSYIIYSTAFGEPIYTDAQMNS